VLRVGGGTGQEARPTFGPAQCLGRVLPCQSGYVSLSLGAAVLRVGGGTGQEARPTFGPAQCLGLVLPCQSGYVSLSLGAAVA
jgi:hypothetical protein